MFDFLLNSQTGESFTVGSTLGIIFSALILGFLISVTYIVTHKREGYSGGFSITLIMLPAIISMIIYLIGNNVARAFSLAGAFSLIRFRSAPGDPKDIAFVFFALGVGLACGMGFIVYAVIFAAVMCLVMFVLYLTNFPCNGKSNMLLKITIPENVDYNGLFDEVFEEYTDSFRFKRVKTVDFGSLFELTYNISLKRGANHKDFIDKLRCRNNNLNITLTAQDAVE